MIRDLRSTDQPSDLGCDVCIVGAGAAGITLAVELSKTALQVVVLESGGESFEPLTQALYKARVLGHSFTGHLDGRFRVFGGTTTRWGGQALPLSKWDLTERPWIQNSGWPLPHDELARYYPRAAELMGLDSMDYAVELARHLHAKLPPFDRQALDVHFAKWSPHPNFADRYDDVLRRSRNILVLLHANLTTITLNDNGAVQSLLAKTLEGKSVRISPRFSVLAAGGLETARLLLANRAQRPNGIGNDHDLVGRFFQDHPGGRFGFVSPNDDVALQELFNVYHRRAGKYTVRFALPTSVQRRESIASASATLMFRAAPESSFESLKRVYQLTRSRQFNIDLLTSLAHCLRDLPGIMKPLTSYARGRTFTPSAEAVLFVSCEQEPNADSRITLGDKVDALGMPVLDIHWALSDITRRTIRLLARTVKREIDNLGLGQVTIDDWVDSDEWRSHVDDHFHHMGTTRMAATPAYGVVDPDCRVFGVSNLYVASSAVFPTGGFSNPTLTILALAVRLAERLNRLCQSAT